MIIKEFRIVIPMSVDEYQIGQLYTIQKKSRLESTGAGSGVEIIENKPFENETEKGQYTLKVYHVDERLPSALKTISKLLFPKSALLFEEESWNSYPYTRTKYHHKLFKSFSIDIESKYLPDYGQSENVFNISKKELSSRIVDFVDIVNDQINPHEYNPDEDPAKFQSQKSKCGPLGANWYEELKANANQKTNLSSISNQKVKYMCAYKLCRVECAFWGFQSKVEKLIVESVLRNMILMSHRQAWCWQDEYLDLSMDDVRRLEMETQEYLRKKMRGELTEDEQKSVKLKVDDKHNKKEECEEFLSQDENSIQNDLASNSTIKNEQAELNSIYDDDEPDFADIEDDNRSIKSNLDEFYDAVSMNSNLIEIDNKKIADTNRQAKRNFSIKRTKADFTKSSTSSNSSSVLSDTKNKCKFDTLIIVVHGGNVTCTDTSKQNDFSNFKSTMETVIKANYGHIYNKIAYRLVACNPICQDALLRLSTLSPVTSDQSVSISESDNFAEASAGIFSLHENLPFNTLPLLALANRTQYKSSLNKFVRECNQVYQQFLNSPDGHSFQGQVVIVGDSLGSLLVYDSLCVSGTYSNYSDDSSTLASYKSSKSQSKNATSSPSNKSPSTNRNSDFLPSPTVNLKDKGISDNLIKRIPSNLSSINGIDFEPQISNSVFLTEERLEFDVTHFFVFGSPLGLILAQRNIANGQIDLPCCTQIYNMFHLTDPIALRIEPLLSKQFRSIEPLMIPRYSKYPLGDGSNLSLDYYILKNGTLFNTNALNANRNSPEQSPIHLDKINSFIVQESANNTSNYEQLKPLQKIIQIKKKWWGENRIDYVLYAPEKIGNLPKKSLPYIFHSYYWESADVVAFILRMISKSDSNSDLIPSESSTLNSKKEPVEKWEKRLNRVKLRNLSANHRANDVVVLEDKEQVLTAKFSYGPLDFALSGEKVDIFVMNKSPSNEWKFYASEKTDNSGKLRHVIPAEKRLSLGVYQIKMMVRCDHSFADFHISVLPANTEAVVFSIDGSFAANISFSGNDPKVRAGAVDVVRHWQDLGYLIIYVTARPDYQHYKVTNWLAQHNFPFGMVFFSDGISRDPIKQKTETLKNIVKNSSLVLKAGYGSAKDIQMYANLGIESQKIFIVGKTKSKYLKQAMVLKNGYASHLSELRNPNNSLFEQANGNARLILKKGNLNVRQNTIFSNQNSEDYNSTNEFTMTSFSYHQSISSM